MLLALFKKIKNIVFHPKTAFEKIFLGTFNRLRKKFLTPNGMHSKISNRVSNFVYDHSNDMPVVMLVFNSISILSSHFAQIHGLKNSNRENKDYLIEQEKSELKLDLLLTIIPPFMINRFLTKKLDSGLWTSKSTREKLVNEVVQKVKINNNDLYNTDHIVPIKDTIIKKKDELLRLIKSDNRIPLKLRLKIRVKPLEPESPSKKLTMNEILTEFDNLNKNKSAGYYNGKAYDDIMGQRNGILLIAGITYTILASNIIMPILKNKLTNKRYKKELEALGETPESMKRKKRYKNLQSPTEILNNENVFNVFSNSDNSTTTTAVVDRTIFNNLLSNQIDNKNIFNDVHTITRSASQSSGLRI